jgi:hypothetical protein
MKLASVIKSRKKAVWGRDVLIAFFIATFAAVSVTAAADQGTGKSSTKKQHPKLDRAVERAPLTALVMST